MRKHEGEEPGAPFFGYSRRVGDDDNVGGTLWALSAALSPTLASQEWGTRRPADILDAFDLNAAAPWIQRAIGVSKRERLVS